MAVSHMRSKNMQYKPNLWRNLLNSHVLQEIWVEEDDVDVILYILYYMIGSGNRFAHAQ